MQEAHSYLHGVEDGEDGEGLRGVEVVAGQGHRQEGQVPSCSSKKIIKGLFSSGTVLHFLKHLCNE
jgi:hypothetical protein